MSKLLFENVFCLQEWPEYCMIGLEFCMEIHLYIINYDIIGICQLKHCNKSYMICFTLKLQCLPGKGFGGGVVGGVDFAERFECASIPVVAFE